MKFHASCINLVVSLVSKMYVHVGVVPLERDLGDGDAFDYYQAERRIGGGGV